MAISNIRVTYSSKTAKVGDKIKVEVRWDGDSDYKGTPAASVYVDGIEGFKSVKRFNGSIYSNYASTEFVVPASMVGDAKGRWNIVWVASSNMVTDTEYSAYETIKVTQPELDFQVTLSPSNPTLKPGESVTVTPTISGVAAPYKATWKWTYALLPQPGYDNKDLVANYQGIGYEFILCDVTVEKDGYPAKTVRGSTKVTGIKGSLDGIQVMIGGLPPGVKVFEGVSANVIVGGIPAGAEVMYQWLVNGVNKGTTKDLSYIAWEPGVDNIQCVVSVYASNYDGVTLHSPIMPITVNKLTIEDTRHDMFNSYFSYWGPKGYIEHAAYVYYDDANRYSRNLKIDYSNPGNKVYFDGVEAPISQDFEKKPSFSKGLLKPSDVKPYTVTADFYYQGDKYCEGGWVHFSKTGAVRARAEFSKAFVVNDALAPAGVPVYIKAAPGQEIQISIRNIFDPSYITQGSLPKEYWDEMNAQGKLGTFELIDKDGAVAATAVNNVFTYTVPDEIKTLTGKIRHTQNDDKLWDRGPYMVEQDITIEITTSPMEPMPTIEVTQTPEIARIGSPVKFAHTLTDVPAGAATESYWFINEEPSGTGDEINPVATREMTTLRNNVFVTPTGGFDPALLSVDFIPTILLKGWPTLAIRLSPARTTVPWGEFLISGFDVVGEEIMDDQDKLVEYKPTWYIDDVEVQTLAGDGSLSIRALNPGNHVIKASVLLTHPDYENGQKSVTASFNMTTEPRDMAITLDLTPKTPKIYLGQTSKFTAAITGAPVDATTTYEWKVDGTIQASVQNTLDVAGVAIGSKTIEVTATTKADGAADDVQTASTTLTIEAKQVMTPTVTATTTTPTITVGQNYIVKCDVTGSPAGATVAYKWDSGETTQSVTKASTSVGSVARKCTVTITAEGYEDFTGDSNTVTVTVKAKVQVTTASVSTTTPKVKVGETYKASVGVNNAPNGSTTTYLWNTGETTQNISGVGSIVGPIKLSCKVTVKATDYEDKVIDTNELTITVEDDSPVVPGECPILYVHPLPWRSSAYIWCGWWVMDEIEKLTSEGKDWKTATSTDSKYYCHLAVLAKMITDYPEVDVQESRNGRIVHRSALEVGIIY